MDRSPYRFCVMTTSSMEPVIAVGDHLFVEDAGAPAFGDLVLLPQKDAGAPGYVHRVIDAFDGRVVTKGDRDLMPDLPTPAGEVRGRVALILRPDGRSVDLGAGAARAAHRAASRVFALLARLRPRARGYRLPLAALEAANSLCGSGLRLCLDLASRHDVPRR